MLALDPAFEGALLDESVDKYLLVRLATPAPMRMALAPRDVEHLGETYLARAPISGLSLPQAEGELAAIELAEGSTEAWGRVRVRRTVEDAGIGIDARVLLVADGVKDHHLDLFRGSVASLSITGPGAFTVGCRDELGDFRGQHGFLVTDEAQRLRRPTDGLLAFAHVHHDLAWGNRYSG